MLPLPLLLSLPLLEWLGPGLRVAEVRTDRSIGRALHAEVRAAAAAAIG